MMGAFTQRIERLAVKVTGVVQGVGFRPFIYQLAQKHNLSGWVRNTSGSVDIEAEGTTESLDSFLEDIRHKVPPAASLESVDSRKIPALASSGFKILESLATEDEYQLISPDLAACEDCRGEIFDPSDRRYRYPFTNCTNCGPRFTIIKDIPYDRPRTTMSNFTMCPDCQREYDNPANRRFHAQPNACPACGPRLELVDNSGRAVPGDPLDETTRLLGEGRIVAVKGLGGFLLACDATNNNAVCMLRQRKRRPSRPFAIMLNNIAEARRYCRISAAEEALLSSPASPIVLLKIEDAGRLAPQIAPGLNHLGVMLPYTPLHHLLMAQTGLTLVMTSGNITEEPIARDNGEALRRLGSIADYFLLHNRDIFVRYDDSVVMCAAADTRVLRRARGLAPHPVKLGFTAPQILACGAEMKGAFCLTRDNYAFLSQHVGDLENCETLDNYEEVVEIYKRLFRVKPQVVACDLHPDYHSTRYAREQAAKNGLKLVAVQHHHAHIAGLLAEHGISGPVIGVAFDGTGYGADGAIWGGEFLIAGLKGFQRSAHLEYLPLPGGDAATRNPGRVAAAYIYHLLGEPGLLAVPSISNMDKEEIDILKTQIDRRLNCPLTSSAGRLFDAVSALLGIRQTVDYEAQAAIELEAAVGGCKAGNDRIYPYGLAAEGTGYIITLAPLFQAIITDIAAGAGGLEIARRFHYSIAVMVSGVCRKLADGSGLDTVGLSGGCFQNRLLLEMTVEALRKEKLKVITHTLVPTNDGGIALGQAAVAAQG
jgi:hydrogenase maturation protein HypF